MNIFVRIKNFFKRDKLKPDEEVLPEIVQRAIECISDDESLTGDLTDEGAKLLLNFAQGEVVRLAGETKGLDAASAWTELEPKISILRQNLRKIARECAQAADPLTELKNRLKPPPSLL